MSTAVQGLAGLDAETLEMTLEAIREFSDQSLPLDRLLELDHTHEFPEETVRAMCSDLGVQLIFIPEAYGGMGGGRLRRLPRLRADGGHRPGPGHRGAGHLPGERPHPLRRHRGAEGPLARPHRRGGPAHGVRRHRARGRQRPGRAAHHGHAGHGGRCRRGVPDQRRQDVDQQRRVRRPLLGAGVGPRRSHLVRHGEGRRGLHARQARGQARHPRQQHRGALLRGRVPSRSRAWWAAWRGRGWYRPSSSSATRVSWWPRSAWARDGRRWSGRSRYSTTRIPGGTPLSQKQGYTHKLIVPHACRLEASRAFIEETAIRIDSGEGTLNTEGAIAKYLATEAGNGAADAAIQAHGGYGYVREYVVEKIRRDVRITTIYEGTSEIMEMTIARDRWQAAPEDTRTPLPRRGRGAGGAARVESDGGRRHRRRWPPTRWPSFWSAPGCNVSHAHQHILFRLGELIAWVEGAGALARRAAAALAGALPEKADRRVAARGAGGHEPGLRPGRRLQDGVRRDALGGGGRRRRVPTSVTAFAAALGLEPLMARAGRIWWTTWTRWPRPSTPSVEA